MTGQTVSHYEVLDRLGQGGMGSVYRARDTRLGRIVALKVLRPETADAERKRRFFNEARAASALNHPNIAAVYDVDVHDGSDFIVMEHVPGRSLDRLIAGRPLPLGDALRYGVQIAAALAAAHEAGIIHRDLKPGNILITDDGRLKVVDFGLAKLSDAHPASPAAPTEAWNAAAPHTEEGTILGTVAYMSPEQAEGKPVDARSDVFSFGAVLYEMLTGRRPFDGESRTSTLAAIVHSEPAPISEMVPSVPREVQRLVYRCLRKQPDRRVQSAADLKLALEDLKEDSDSGELAPTTPKPVPKRSRRMPLIGTAGFLGVVVVAITAALMWQGHQRLSLRSIPLTSAPGAEDYPAFSPDGNRVAYSWSGDRQDNYDIYLQVAPGDRPLRLTTDPAPDTRPVWSPDGRQIAFHRGGPWPGTWVVGALGGPERKVAENVIPGAWSADGTELIVTDQRVISAVPVNSGEPRQLTYPTAEYIDSQPVLSPDGRYLAFVRTHGVGTSLSDVYRVDLQTAGRDSVPVRLTHVRALILGLSWTADSREIVFSSVHTGAPSLWRVPAFGSGDPRPLEGVGPDAVHPSVSPQRNRLVYATRVLDTNLWSIPAASDGHRITRFDTSAPSIITTANRQDRFPQYSPDGTRLLFVSDRSGMDQIWVSNTDGSNAAQLTSFAGASPSYWPRWSPDGWRIVFNARPGDNVDVYMVNAPGSGLQRVTDLPGNELWPDWSASGNWILYSRFGNGQEQIWKAPAEGGGEHRIVTKGGGAYMPRSAPGGKYVYFLRRGNGDLWRVPVEGGREERVLAGVDWEYAPWGDGICYLDSHTGQLKFYDVVRRKLTATGTAILNTAHYGVTVSPDGRTVVFTRQDRLEGDLVTIENFR